jgi:sec-independent protein translocase protein TatA
MATYSPTLAIGGLGGMEVILLVFVVLLLFGAKRLPELAKGLGKSVKEFKKAANETTDDDEHPAADAAKKADPAAKTNGAGH